MEGSSMGLAMEGSSMGLAMKEAEKGAAKSGGEANVEAVLEQARKEITTGSLKRWWQDAAEFAKSPPRDFQREVYERALRRMSSSLGLRQPLEGGHVVGHALMRAAEAGALHVLRRLRTGLAELRCSELAPRFLAFSLLKAAELGHVEVVEELLAGAFPAGMVGYELAHRAKEDGGYPFVVVSLTPEWHAAVRHFKSLLPPARCCVRVPGESLELHFQQQLQVDDEHANEALVSCYRTYCFWRLMIVAGANNHGGVFREFLVRKLQERGGLQQPRRSSMLMGYESPKVAELNKVRNRIDEECTRFVMKITAKLCRDMLLYEVFRSTEGKDPHHTWHRESKAQFGLWQVMLEVPVLLMDPEGSYQDLEKKKLLRNYHYIKPIIPQVMKLHVQLKIIIDVRPDCIELVVALNHVRVTVDNQRWEEQETGHFPTRVSLSVTPVTPTLTSVTMTGSSSNTTYKVGVAENVRIGVQATLKAAPTAGITFQAGKTTIAKIEGKPWRMEQLPVYNERGGSFTWQLTNLHGASFDRLSPMLQETKKSIWQFGKRVPINPLLVLPFGTNGGVNFTGSEFDDTLSWRFPVELENTMAPFNIEGQVHTTYITQDTFWETRVVPFEVQIEQKLEPTGDPSGGDKKKKNKKKK